jgi:pimeloyl-ACP methyl ester carboxylesterase
MPSVRTAVLEIAYEESGAPDGVPVILLHGFPDDIRTWDGVVPLLAGSGLRVIVPYLRGYGPTRFLDPATPRSGQQAALGADLRDFMDAMGIGRALLAGYDWGGRAACIVSALWPERVRGLVTVNGYNIQAIASATRPAPATRELAYWYQWYFMTERGRAGLAADPGDICRLLWRMWSPNWHFDEATFARTEASWKNPDFVDVVIQSYRHRNQTAPGDPALEEIERLLAAQPPITVPTIVLNGTTDMVGEHGAGADDAVHFPALRARRVVPGAGHFLPREAPGPIADAVADLLAQTG